MRHVIHPGADNYLPFLSFRRESHYPVGSPGHRWSLHFLTSSPVPSHCCPVSAAPWHTRARLCHPPSQDLEQPLHGPQGFHWPLARTESPVTLRYSWGAERESAGDTSAFSLVRLNICVWCRAVVLDFHCPIMVATANFPLPKFCSLSRCVKRSMISIRFTSCACHAFSLWFGNVAAQLGIRRLCVLLLELPFRRWSLASLCRY